MLLSLLLTIFALLQKEQYLWLFCCCTSVTFCAPVWQQWRLNSCIVPFKSTAGNVSPCLEGFYVSCHITCLTSCYWLYTNNFNSWLNPPVAKLSYQYAEIGKLSPKVATHCWSVSCQQTFKPAVIGHSLKDWYCSTTCSLPLLVCTLGWSIKDNQST